MTFNAGLHSVQVGEQVGAVGPVGPFSSTRTIPFTSPRALLPGEEIDRAMTETAEEGGEGKGDE